MIRSNTRYSTSAGWPDKQKKLLLQSAFLTDSDQVGFCWEQWLDHINWNRIDQATRTILPVVLQNLLIHDITVAPDVQTYIQKQYFDSYIQNQLVFKQAVTLIQQLQQAGFKTLALKGMPLALQYYNKLGLRFMSDVDLLIPTHQAFDCIAYMQKLDWKPSPRNPENFSNDFIAVSHGYEFYHSDGRKIDLHWHVMHECCQPNADNDFWEAAIPFNFSGITIHALNPADQLLHTCVHSARFGSSTPLKSLVDVMLIVNRSPVDLDWKRLLHQAQKRKIILPVRETLFYVSQYLNARIPNYILEQFQQTPVTKYQQIEYEYKRQNYHLKKFGYVPIMIFDYLRLRHHIGLWQYLHCFWGTGNNRETLRFFLNEIRKFVSTTKPLS